MSNLFGDSGRKVMFQFGLGVYKSTREREIGQKMRKIQNLMCNAILSSFIIFDV